MRLAHFRLSLRVIMTAVALVALMLGTVRAIQGRQFLLRRAVECETREDFCRRNAESCALLAGLYEAPPATDLTVRETEERMHALGTGGCVVFRTSRQKLNSI